MQKKDSPLSFNTLLKESIPNRFLNLSPNKFEDFILTLFQDMGYNTELTPRTGDYGGDVIAEKDRESIVVQVKRYKWTNVVGVSDINQVVGAKQFYDTNKAIIVTTSRFSKNGKELAKRTGVELWDWEILYSKIKDIYLDGKDVYEYFKDNEEELDMDAVINNSLEFKVIKTRENQLMQDKTTSTIIHFKIKNLSDEMINVQILPYPIIIDVLNNQFSAVSAYEGYFREGEIYPNASIEASYNFLVQQVPDTKSINKIIIKYLEGIYEKNVTLGIPKTIEIENPIQTSSNCFIATATYGTPLSKELDIFRNFRDTFLLNHYLGTKLVKIYYFVSPRIADNIRYSNNKRKIMRIILDHIYFKIKNS